MNTRPSWHSYRIILFSLIATIATFCIATIYPSGPSPDHHLSLSFAPAHAWIASQAFLLTLPGVALGLFANHFRRLTIQTDPGSSGASTVTGMATDTTSTDRWPMNRWILDSTQLLALAMIVAVPVWVLGDIITFTWIGERLCSRAFYNIGTTLLPGILSHTTYAQFIAFGLVSISVITTIIGSWKFTGWVARRWSSHTNAVRPSVVMIVFSSIALMMASPGLWQFERTAKEMRRCSTRHPICNFGLIGHTGIGRCLPTSDCSVLSRLRGVDKASSVFRREKQLSKLRIQLQSDAMEDSHQPLPDIVMVVVESLRPEMIANSTMPHLAEYSEKSIWCQQHFSGGNSTALGMFSMMTGLEATWFERPIKQDPTFNRFLHQAGYEIAFYAGDVSFPSFGMHQFLNEDVYDDFQIEPTDVPKTDLKAIQLAQDFLARKDVVEANVLAPGKTAQSKFRKPRAVVVYLMGTHRVAMYSDPEDQVDQPASTEFLLGSHNQEFRNRVFNGYRNSVRWTDRIIAPLLRDDCVVVVAGDHGEPFLDDGTQTHGTRLSKYQNMTPAVFYHPGVKPRKIQSPTSHIDLIPTLMSVLNREILPQNILDGVDLLSATEKQLRQRCFATTNIVDQCSMLIGPWTQATNQPFGYRVMLNLQYWQAGYLNPIDERGYQVTSSNDTRGMRHFNEWLATRLGEQASSQNDNETEQALFRQTLTSTDPRIQIAALRIAEDITDPPEYLLDILVQTAQSENQDVRKRARRLVINRIRVQNSLSNPPR